MEKLQATSIRLPSKKIIFVFAAVWISQLPSAAPEALAAGPVPAAAKGAAPLDFDYPELQMTPLMSERIERESAFEAESKWTRMTPIQTSAALTLVAGITQLTTFDWSLLQTATAENPIDSTNTNIYNSGAIATSVGAAQLIASLIVSATYSPYKAAKDELKSSAGSSSRDKLARERYAEENIEAAARVGRILTWATVLPGLAASSYILASSMHSQTVMTLGGISLAGSLLPLLFPTRWQIVAGEQADYKKRIYGPIGEHGGVGLEVAATPLFTRDRLGKSEAAPGLLATLRF